MFILELSMMSNIATDDRKSTTISVEDINHVVVKREELDFLTSIIDDTNDKYFILPDDDDSTK